VLGRMVRQLSEELDGFAHDLHAYVCAPAGEAHDAARADMRDAQGRRSPARTQA
jgi:biopolymer transport protein ExbB